ELRLQYTAMAGILLLLALCNGALYLRLRSRTMPSEGEFFLHLLLDVLGLSLLLYLSGGANNPFVSYFLVSVTIAAATLAWTWTALLASIALACYSLLLFFYAPLEPFLPHSHGATTAEDLHGAVALDLHIVGMWLNFLVSASLITWFVAQMAAEIRRQQEGLSRYREDTLRNEQVLAVATQAAGAAHDLGTPLGTMTLILKDLQLDHGHDPVLTQELHTLQQQVETCRKALQQLSRQADFRNLQREKLPVDSFLSQLLGQWQLLRPEVPCRFQWAPGPAPEADVDPTLNQALINILNNAADASPQGMELQLDWTDSHWRLRVRDFGAGVPRELREQLGTRVVSTKEGGMGIGLVLSQATINRLGGKVSLYPQMEQNQIRGTLTEVVLPLKPPRAAGHA
ncbi:MAG TPA: HAMP domain-containing histidine kinase, partial [Pseudomonadaceae bacterium]|nr:HAMP domain-containing histidine kinase [Pseudomonadaceae bacterium]